MPSPFQRALGFLNKPSSSPQKKNSRKPKSSSTRTAKVPDRMKHLDKICTAIYVDRALYSRYKALRRIHNPELSMSEHVEEFFRNYVKRGGK